MTYRVSSDDKRRDTAELYAYEVLFRSQRKDTIPAAFFFWPTYVRKVYAYCRLCSTIVLGLLIDECKEYMFREDVGIGMRVIDAENSVRNILHHEDSERCKSQPIRYSNSRYYKPST